MAVDAAFLERVREAQAFLNANSDVLAAIEKARKEDLGAILVAVVDKIIETGTYTESESSAFAGYMENGLPVRASNGTIYSVNLSATDVKRKAKRVDGVDFKSKKTREAEAKAAEAAGQPVPVSLVKDAPEPEDMDETVES